MSKAELIQKLESIIEKYGTYNDAKYAMVVVEAIKTLADLQGWSNGKKDYSGSGVAGSW